jgi:DNA polymerase (family 10)
MSLNADLSSIFQKMAAVLEIRGEPVFKAIAFSKVARLLDDNTLDLRHLVQTNALESVEGIGKSSRKIIEEYVRTGRSDDVDSLLASVPAGLIELLDVPGLGPKTIALLWRERGVEGKAQLQAAIEQGQLEGLKRIGPKKIEQIKQGLVLREQAGQRFGIGHAIPIAEAMLDAVCSMTGVERAVLAGSLRRMKETIGDVDILAQLAPGTDPSSVTDAFSRLPEVAAVLGAGPTKSSVRTTAGLQVDLRIVPAAHFGAALQYFTGSKEHNVKLRGIAQSKGLTLNEWGLWKQADWDAVKESVIQNASPDAKPARDAVAGADEAGVYAALGLAFVEPELREDRGEIELAQSNSLPKLIERSDIRGELHCHSTASDGEASVEQMVDAARAIGHAYLVITDHSQSQAIARGLTVERLLKHIEHVRAVASKLKGFDLLIGSEVDILADGSLDYGDDVLRELDFVVASPHTALRQDATKATERLLRAIDNKYVNVIGHPTGRLINQRTGLDFEWTKVFEAAHASGTAMEINAAYPRLDLSDLTARAAIRAGVMLTIDTDAHNTASLDGLDLGLAVARRAGATRDNVLNTQPIETVRAWVKAKRDR